MTMESQQSSERPARATGRGAAAATIILLLIAGYVLLLYPIAVRELGIVMSLSRPHR